MPSDSRQRKALIFQKKGLLLTGVFCRYQQPTVATFALTLTSEYLLIWLGFIPIRDILYFR